MKERDQKILDLYRSGMLIKHIAVEVGLAPNSVGVILKKIGVARPGKPQKQKPALCKDEDMLRLWDEGLDTSSIAERYGIGVQKVRKVLTDNGRDLSIMRHRYDGRAGSARRSGNAFARIAGRT